MANIKSAKKRIKQIEVRTLRNKIRKTMVRTAVRRFEGALNRNDMDAAEMALRFCYARLDRAAQKGAIHRNAAARKKSRLTQRFNKVKSQSA
ncbi:MAG: 30S ribosomal protein S20 [Firmicutes bacterium]|uniref:Small ribosomal subunit protein bS20 n=1 Tax=Sulfobacillus benefaciens TaxID=453960 RepID=A0A2T2X7D9_9FIRM|nr:30S ribosomal protein S20 [Bacillota bacterium]MCL5013631.1 30S ribosomal protein S20 [Bacillota bacterium]PSR30421.1 MAG: 30S ribosomal protein S20 [Sulfobacillus benefaciens]HBQ96697.1 30S ribosomal protein S20 [Sulfobacillus sp.]